MPTIPSGCQFYAANLYVYYYYYSYITDGELYAGAYQVMHSWSENELTWNIAQPSSTTYISSTRLSTGYMSGARGAYSGSPKTASFDVTTAAASWYANPSSNFGIALKYQSGTNSSVILKSYEAGSEYRAYFVITYTEPQIVNGVYRIKNAQNGMYLDTTGGGVTAGTKIQQWSRASSDTNRNQLFKITFVRTIGSTEQLNYYTIRPMTNNRMGLDSLLGGTAQDVTIEKMSTSDNWDYILYNNLWSISKSGSYYTVKNGRISDMSYMTAPSNTINGAKIFTNDSITDYSKWVLEPYTGEELNGVGWISFASTLIVGERFSYEAYMYDNRIGINGPISYSVTNTDNSTTDKATIDAMGRIRALKPGTIKIKITYPSSTLIWWWIVTIEESMEGLHFIKNRHYDRYAQVDDNDAPGYANNGGIMEIWPFSGENHQRWNLTHVGNGYYKIASQASGYVITVPAGKETNDNVDLVLKPYTGSNNQKWRITLTSHGSYKIKAKSSESYTSKDLVMDLETNILYNNGLNIRQREYLDNTSYKDEWLLHMQKDYTLMYIGYSVGDSLMPPIVSAVDSALQTQAKMNGYGYTSLSKNELLVHLSSTSIFSCITHGLSSSIGTSDGTLTINDINSLNNTAFNNLKFVYFGACLTGSGRSGGTNLVNTVYNKGADTVLGFTIEVFVSETNLWTQSFMTNLATGVSINSAMNTADITVRNDPGIDVPFYSTSSTNRYLAGSAELIPCR